MCIVLLKYVMKCINLVSFVAVNADQFVSPCCRVCSLQLSSIELQFIHSISRFSASLTQQEDRLQQINQFKE